jgi:hypothetical protein
MCTEGEVRTWKDEIVGLFLDGRLAPASAAQVRAAMDRIASSPRHLAALERLDGPPLRHALEKLVGEVLAEQRYEGEPLR